MIEKELPPSKNKVLILTENPNEFENIRQFLVLPDFDYEFFSDPTEYVKRIQSIIPVACLIDLDTKNTKIPKALLLSIRKVYGKGFLVFGATKIRSSDLIDFMIENEITSIIPKNADQDVVNKKMIEVIRRVYAPASPPKKIAFPEAISWFFNVVSPALAKLCTALESIEEPETRLNFYVEQLQFVRQPLIEYVQSLSKRKEELHFHQCLRLYGFENCRNLLVSLTLSKVLGVELIKWSEKNPKPVPEPKAILQYATKALQSFEEGRYQYIAYTCGLVFDYFFHLNEVSSNKNALIKKLIDTRFTNALSAIKTHLIRAKDEKDLAYERHILTFFFISEIGKIMMAFQYKDYIDFIAKAEKKNLKAILLHLAEATKFGVTHTLLASLTSQVMTGLSDASESLQFAAHPFLIAKEKRLHHSYNLIRFCTH